MQSFKLNSYDILTPPTIYSPLQWLSFQLYEMLPKFPRYAPNPFLLNHFSYYYYPISWHSYFPTIFPHSQSFRMLRAILTNNMSQTIQLINKGFPIDSPIDKKYGFNALQIAAMSNHYPLIQMLLLRGADIDLSDPQGNTPLMHAVNNQNFQAINSLVKSGCNINIKNKYGVSALDKSQSVPSIHNFLLNGDQYSKRIFPRFRIKLKIEKRIKRKFWEQIEKLKIYSSEVKENVINRWQFDFTDYQRVEEVIR